MCFRVYALYGGNWRVLLLVPLTLMIEVPVAIVRLHSSHDARNLSHSLQIMLKGQQSQKAYVQERCFGPNNEA